MNFLFIWMLIMLIGGAFFAGHEWGYLEGQKYEKQKQGYRFNKTKKAFAGIE